MSCYPFQSAQAFMYAAMILAAFGLVAFVAGVVCLVLDRDDMASRSTYRQAVREAKRDNPPGIARRLAMRAARDAREAVGTGD